MIKSFPTSTFGIAQNMLQAFQVYSVKLQAFANYDNSTILSNGAHMLLNNLGLLHFLKDTPENMLLQFVIVLPRISAELRQIISYQWSIGKLTVNLNNDIKNLERSLNVLVKNYLKNDVTILAQGRKSDFEPTMKCLQKLSNTIAVISETILIDPDYATNEAFESMTLMSIILTHCSVMVQGVKSTLASLIHSKTNQVPHILNSYLHSADSLIVGLTDSIRSLVNITVSTLRGLLGNVVGINTLLNNTLKNVLGLTTGTILNAKKVVDNLAGGISHLTKGLLG